jgi:CRISPR system Cascade subunit CasE
MSALLAPSSGTTTGVGPLYMLHLPIDQRRLTGFAIEHRLTPNRRPADSGYQLHALLVAIFRSLAPKPFAASRRRGGRGDLDPVLPVLGYSREPLAALREQADRTALPQWHQALLWNDAAEKRMPDQFPAGLQLGFELRACPVVRLGRGTTAKSPGAELDAFLAALDRADREGSEAPDRATCYRDWLASRFAAGGAARLVRARIDAQQQRRFLFRRGALEPAGGRPVRVFERPDIGFTGTIEVGDPVAFRDLLARGVGRHRAFGFGMLLLRPLAGSNR